jgi:hypothetical protein
MAFEPLAGRRHVEATERKTAADFARLLRAVSDEPYPEAERIHRVCDNLNTHGPSSLYEAFEPAEARRLAGRFERHYTPKHGPWLNVAARQCLGRRIPDLESLRREVRAWQEKRNVAVVKVEWQFTAADTRVKVKSLYPIIEMQ